jgi:hypothetical protein
MCNCVSSGGLVFGGQSYPDCDPCCGYYQRFDKAKKNLKQFKQKVKA